MRFLGRDGRRCRVGGRRRRRRTCVVAAANWSRELAGAVWRLMTPLAVPALRDRVFMTELNEAQRLQALESIAFIRAPSAADAMADIANLASEKALAERATFWVRWNHDRWWRDYKPVEKLKSGGARRELLPVVTPEETGESKLPPVADILKLDADPARGKIAVARCVVCHVIDGIGVDVGPNLTGWGSRFPREVIAKAIVDPSAEIALGFGGRHVVTKSGIDIMGIPLSQGDPIIMKSMGGLTQAVPADQVKSNTEMKRSLMMSADQLGLSAQEVADIIAYLREGTE